jgi:NAD(P)-dependent dehydrogenase (short-subunit alcohol dehydrogenase family)
MGVVRGLRPEGGGGAHRHAALGRAADIAVAVLFLAANRISWITGQVLPVTEGPA